MGEAEALVTGPSDQLDFVANFDVKHNPPAINASYDGDGMNLKSDGRRLKMLQLNRRPESDPAGRQVGQQCVVSRQLDYTKQRRGREDPDPGVPESFRQILRCNGALKHAGRTEDRSK